MSDSPPRPPKTKTLEPIDAIACPERAFGVGPIFWNMYHRWSKHNVNGASIIRKKTRRTGHLERPKITKILAIDSSTTEDVDHIINDSRRMAFTRGRNEPDAGQLGPGLGVRIECPGVVVMILAISSTKAVGLNSVSSNYR